MGQSFPLETMMMLRNAHTSGKWILPRMKDCLFGIENQVLITKEHSW